MGLTAKFKGDLDATFKALLREVEAQTLESLRYIGEEAVKIAKNIPKGSGFEDQTGNLRSSIGYVVFKDGVAIDTLFEASTKGNTPGTEGVTEGMKLAKQVGAQYTDGYTLVVVAGMKYAVHVESGGAKNRKPRDVLTSAELYAKKEIAKHLADMVTNIQNAFN